MVATTFFTLHIPYELRCQLIYEHKKAKIANAKATIVCLSTQFRPSLPHGGLPNVDALVAWRGVNF